ncbi:MAG: hypothetical protein Q9196_006711 [Gyalolechia fulgens]
MASDQEKTLTTLEPYHVPPLHGSPILLLPPEIRFMFYRLLFTKHDVVKKPFEAGVENKYRSHYSTDKYLAQIGDKSILFVCKLLHREAMTILYSVATLRIHLEENKQGQIANMTRLILPGIMNTVTRVSINVQRGALLADNLWTHNDTLIVSPESLRPVMDQFPALEELEITCHRLIHYCSRMELPLPLPWMDYSELKKIPIIVKPGYKNANPYVSDPSAYPRSQSVFKIEDDAVTFDEPIPTEAWGEIIWTNFSPVLTGGALAPEHIFGVDNRYLCPPQPKGKQPCPNEPDGDTKSGKGKLKE